ncbi:MAG: SAM-dependent methyltransferase [Gammaproteobacteria bacterium]
MASSDSAPERGPWALPADWPAPPPEAVALSERLVAMMRAEMERAGGAIGFARFMELALYAPGLGYYSAGLRKFGQAGDFVTAPELSALFARCVARTCAPVLTGGGDLLELGAGSGIMAADLLTELERLGALPGRYWILERSADLRERQRETLSRRAPDLAARVDWLDTLPAAGFQGVMVGNEVLDALPVERFRWRAAGAEELAVGWAEPGFGWQPRPAGRELVVAAAALAAETGLSEGYVSEVNLQLGSWLGSLAERLGRGLILMIDYGYPRREYYHPERAGGTLMCHYRQRAHGDPLMLPGLQDITAHVDFTAVAEAAVAAGLDVLGFATQAHYLMDAGLDTLLGERSPEDGAAYLDLARQAKTLTLPGEMGERFKAIALGRGLDDTPVGFRLQDLRNRL